MVLPRYFLPFSPSTFIKLQDVRFYGNYSDFLHHVTKIKVGVVHASALR